MACVLENKEEINKRIFVFPSSVIEENGKKISYFEKNCYNHCSYPTLMGKIKRRIKC